jgi:hypothetical protein
MSCAIVTIAHAVPITYTMRGVASGSLGATGFSGATFAVTVVADTAAMNSLGPGIPCIDPKQATFTLSDLGTGSITTPISVADNAAWQLVALVRGRCVESGPMWTNGRNPDLGSYDLATELPPMVLEMPSAPLGIVVETSRGMLVFESVSALTFEANLKNDAAATVPGAATAPPDTVNGRA